MILKKYATYQTPVRLCFQNLLLIYATALCLEGCASYEEIIPPPPRLLTAKHLSTAESVMADPLQSLDNEVNALLQSAIQSNKGLNLPQAIDIALKNHPALAAASLEVQARAGEIQQAGLLPNPQVQTDFENFGGKDALSGFDGAETTLTLGQLIELGGKRSQRKKAATLEAQLASWDLEAKRIAIYTEITKLYIAAVAADRKFKIAEQLFFIAQHLQEAVDARVKAGKVSPIEKQRATIVVGRASVERETILAGRNAAFRNLAASLGAPSGKVYILSGQLSPVAAIPKREQIYDFISENPDVARWSAEIAALQAALDLERANRFPDVTLGGGIRHFEDTDDNAYVAVFSLPLPLFNRNQGAIATARSRLAGSHAQAENAKLAASMAFEQAFADLSATTTRALVLQDNLLPTAKTTFNATQTGYREGKFDLVTLLDAQRTYFEIETDTIDALAAYYAARADVEALIGRDLYTTDHTREGRN
jgi:cobalt-zinc-cadmium efflux system outer membrane protein